MGRKGNTDSIQLREKVEHVLRFAYTTICSHDGKIIHSGILDQNMVKGILNFNSGNIK